MIGVLVFAYATGLLIVGMFVHAYTTHGPVRADTDVQIGAILAWPATLVIALVFFPSRFFVGLWDLFASWRSDRAYELRDRQLERLHKDDQALGEPVVQREVYR